VQASASDNIKHEDAAQRGSHGNENGGPEGRRLAKIEGGEVTAS
jgi:hypothetical protein